MSAEDIEIAAGWDGEPGQFTVTLSEVRFLDGEAQSYRIHDWADHNPWAAGRGARVEAAKRAASERWKKKRSPDAERMPGACGSHAGRIDPHCGSHDSAMPTTTPHTTPQIPPGSESDFDFDVVLEENARAREATDLPIDFVCRGYSKRICEELQLPKDDGNVRAFAGALEVLIRGGRSAAASFQFLLARAKDWQESENGPIVWHFWCRDAKFNFPAGATYGREKLSRAQERDRRGSAAILEALRDHVNERIENQSGKLPD